MDCILPITCNFYLIGGEGGGGTIRLMFGLNTQHFTFQDSLFIYLNSTMSMTVILAPFRVKSHAQIILAASGSVHVQAARVIYHLFNFVLNSSLAPYQGLHMENQIPKILQGPYWSGPQGTSDFPQWKIRFSPRDLVRLDLSKICIYYSSCRGLEPCKYI